MSRAIPILSIGAGVSAQTTEPRDATVTLAIASRQAGAHPAGENFKGKQDRDDDALRSPSTTCQRRHNPNSQARGPASRDGPPKRNRIRSVTPAVTRRRRSMQIRSRSPHPCAQRTRLRVCFNPVLGGLGPRIAEMYIEMYTKDMSKQYSIADARRNLPSVIDEAESGLEVQLTRRGKAVAVVVSVEAYERLKSQRSSFGEAYQDFRKRYPAGQSTGEQVAGPKYFRALRDRSRGRKVEF